MKGARLSSYLEGLGQSLPLGRTVFLVCGPEAPPPCWPQAGPGLCHQRLPGLHGSHVSRAANSPSSSVASLQATGSSPCFKSPSCHFNQTYSQVLGIRVCTSWERRGILPSSRGEHRGPAFLTAVCPTGSSWGQCSLGPALTLLALQRSLCDLWSSLSKQKSASVSMVSITSSCMVLQHC